MKRLLAVALAPLAISLALAGCGAEQSDESTERFQGAEREVADQVEELQSAGEGNQPEDICSNILSRQLVDELEAAGADCAQEMEKAIEDSDEFDFVVRDVTVSGTQAEAVVRQGDDGPQTTMQFVREGGQWRATSLNADS
jgi:hypothetical protein